MKSCLFLGLLILTAHASTFGDIFSGFVEGLQVDVTDPSPCVEAYPPITENWGNFTASITSDWILAVDELRDSVASLNDLIAKCAIVDMYDLVLHSFTAEGSGELLVKISLGYSYYGTQGSKLSTLLDEGNYTGFGLTAGETFKELYGFSI